MRYARLHALPILVAVTAASISSRVVDAHVPLHGVGTVCTIVFDEDKARLTFDLSYDGFWAQAEMIGIDEDKTSVVEADEADAYLERQWKQKIAPRLRALVGGKEVKIRRVGARHENLIGEIFGIPFSLYYDLEIDLPVGDVSDASRRSWREFEFHDTVVRDETPAKPRFFIPYEGHGEKANGRFRPDFPKPQIAILDAKSYVIEGESVLVRFRFEPTDGKSGSVESVAETVPAPPPDEEPSEAKPDGMGRVTDHDDELVSALTEGEDLGWLEKIGLLLLAVLWGAGHAMTPGHGKSMVAAYLIGTRGRVRDAVILGTTTTITHTGSVFLFGAGIYLIMNATVVASSAHVQNIVIVGTKLASGLMLVVVGLALFYRRLRGVTPGHSHHHGHSHSHGHSHGHEHGHSHSHGHSHDSTQDQQHDDNHDEQQTETYAPRHQDTPGKGSPPPSGGEPQASVEPDRSTGTTPRLWELITLGFSGGLVPCPAGLTVILLGLQSLEHLAFALVLLVFFSIGLGVVLVAIGVLLIAGKAIVGAYSHEGAFFREMGFLQRFLSPQQPERLDQLGAQLLRVLPAISCLLIAALGAYFVSRTVLTDRTEIVAMLRMLANWAE